MFFDRLTFFFVLTVWDLSGYHRLMLRGVISGWSTLTRGRQGFSLIELLVVISIIGVLITFSIANYTQLRRSARDAQRKSDLKTLQSALELFYNSPPPPSGPSYPAGATWQNELTTGANPFIQPRNWPQDPTWALNYFYNPTPVGCSTGLCQRYSLIACLENVNDPEKDAADETPGDLCPNLPGRVSYTVISP